MTIIINTDIFVDVFGGILFIKTVSWFHMDSQTILAAKRHWTNFTSDSDMILDMFIQVFTRSEKFWAFPTPEFLRLLRFLYFLVFVLVGARVWNGCKVFNDHNVIVFFIIIWFVFVSFLIDMFFSDMSFQVPFILEIFFTEWANQSRSSVVSKMILQKSFWRKGLWTIGTRISDA